MSDQQRAGSIGMGGTPFPDPFTWWRQVYEANAAIWSRSMETMGADAFSETMNRYMQSYMQAYVELQDLTRRSMERYMETLNVPSRDETGRIVAHVARLETKLDDLDAKTAELVSRPPARPATATEERVAGLQSQIVALNEKLDRVLAAIEGGQRAEQLDRILTTLEQVQRDSAMAAPPAPVPAPRSATAGGGAKPRPQATATAPAAGATAGNGGAKTKAKS